MFISILVFSGEHVLQYTKEAAASLTFQAYQLSVFLSFSTSRERRSDLGRAACLAMTIRSCTLCTCFIRKQKRADLFTSKAKTVYFRRTHIHSWYGFILALIIAIRNKSTKCLVNDGRCLPPGETRTELFRVKNDPRTFRKATPANKRHA